METLSTKNNECGTFLVDEDGIVQDFRPAINNPIIDEEYKNHDNYEYYTNKAIRNLIIPEGIKGFRSGFFRGIRVLEQFVLPESLEEIANDESINSPNERTCVFANCVLPKVVIPENVKKIGDFAFGHCHIEELVMSKYIQIPNLRQFKDGYIGKLILPIELRSAFNRFGECKGIMWLHNAKIGEVIYYDK